MSTLDVVAEILREVAPRALCAKEIADLAGERLPTASRTPQTVVSRDLAIDVRDRGAASRFLRVDRGEFVLKEALPTALYSDNDAYAAQWTRNLVEAGQIAKGVVDERSIRDLRAADVASYRQFHAFSGIGTWSRALRDAGWGDDVPVWTGSCPCQPFSQAGRKAGFDDEQHLWPEWFRLIRECRPPCIFGEQVSSKDGLAWLDVVFADLEGEGYAVRAIDSSAAGVGSPHLRQRLYFVALSRERGCEVVRQARLHDRRQSGYDLARCSEAHIPDASFVSDSAGTRLQGCEDAGADRGDEGAGADPIGGRTAGDLEFERSGAPDEPSAVSDAECVVRDAGRLDRAHGREAIEPDGHGQAHGADAVVDTSEERREGGAPCDGEAWDGRVAVGSGCHCLGYDVNAIELGDAGLAGSRRDAGALPRAEGAGEGERIESGDFADESVAPGAADVSPVDTFTTDAFRPGDRVRLDDPTWGGAVGGYWARDVEWIYCRPTPGHQDGCFRPAQSGTQPLVDGLAEGVGRTRAKRLRGFGNGIVLPQAVQFVGAVMDAITDVEHVEPSVVKVGTG